MATGPENSAELMSAYLDAELDASQTEAFEKMLAESPEVQEELEDLRKVVSLVSAMPAVEAPEDFYDKLSRKLRRKSWLGSDGVVLGLISLPFQVLSIIVILTVAAIYMMAQLEQAPRAIEADPAVQADDPHPPRQPSPPVP